MKKYFFSSKAFKKITATIALVLVVYSGYSFNLIELMANVNCSPRVVFIPDSLQNDLENVDAYINISTAWGTTNPSYSNTMSLTDSDYFEYLGYVILDPSDSVGSIRYAYRYISTDFTPDVAGVTNSDIEIDYNGQYFWDFGSMQKNCIVCPNCIGRYSTTVLASMIFGDVFYWNNYNDYISAYNLLPAYQQQQIATIMNWLLDNEAPTITDYADLLNPSNEGNSTIPSVFCADPGSGLHNSCSDQSIALALINSIDSVLSGIPTDDFGDFSNYQNAVSVEFISTCIASGGYFPFMYSTEDPNGYELGLIPLQAGLPTIISKVVFDNDTVYTTVAYSYNYMNLDSGIVYTDSGNFQYLNGFRPANQTDGDIPFPNATIFASRPITFCNGDSVAMVVKPLYSFSSYLWSNGDSTSIIKVRTSGLYSVEVWDADGCWAEADTVITVTVNNNPVVNAGNDTIICNGVTVQLGGDTVASNGTPPYSFAWSPSTGLSSTTVAQPTANATATTNYILTVTDSNTCVGKDTVVVTVNALPSAPTAPTAQTVCCDTAYTFVFSNVTTGTGGNEIEWATNSNFTSSTIVSSPGNISVTVNAGYADTIWLRSKDSTTGCVSAPSITIATTNRLPDSSFWFVQKNLLVAGDSIPVIVLNSENAVLYNLISGDSVFDSKLGNGDTLILNTHSLTGNYYFNIRATDTVTGCSLVLDSSILIMLRQAIKPPHFYKGASALFAGDVSYYLATAQDSPIIYSIVSGDAIIDSVTGFVSYTDSNFIVRATITDTLGIFTLHTDYPVSVIPPDSSGVFLNVTVSENSALPISHDTTVTLSSHLNSILSLFGATDYFQRYPSANDPLLDSIYTIYATGNIKQLRDSLATLNLFSQIKVIKFMMPALVCTTAIIAPVITPECGATSAISTNDPLCSWSNDLDQAPCAWTVTKGNPDIVVGIADYGFDINHPDLSGQIVNAWNNYASMEFHGTMVAGCVAAATDNGIGMASLGYMTRIATYQISGDPEYSGGDPGPAIWQAYLDRRPIINCSWSGGPGTLDAQAVTDIYNANILLVVSSGDYDGVEPNWSSLEYDDRAMEVTSVESDNSVSGFTLNDWVAIAAPGGRDNLLIPTYPNYTPSTSYTTADGTSFSAPRVAAAAALLLSVDPCLRAEDLRKILMTTAMTPQNSNFRYRTDHGGTANNQGAGSLDAYQAVLMAQTYAATYGVHAPITTNTIWNTNTLVSGDLTIEQGATLTINNGAIISFFSGSNLIVEPGAKLIVNGATLTSKCTWGGIIVKGNKRQPQDLSTTNNYTAMSVNQGFVYLNNATIENAYEALRIWNPDDGWVSDQPGNPKGGTGGIVRAVNTTFHNNRRSAEFMWYRYYHIVLGDVFEAPNASYFYHCHFNVDINYDAYNPFDAHVTMWGTNGIQFEGCDFQNNDTRTATAAGLGMGIRSIDASYTVKNWGSVSSLFKNLHDGILAENTDPNQSVYVYDAQFTDNQSGVNITGINHSAVNGNTFTIGHLPTSIGLYIDPTTLLLNPTLIPIAPDNNVVGIAFDNSTQFQIEFNHFNSNNGIDNLSPFQLIGSGFTNTSQTGLYNNQCLANDYHGIAWANLANYTNRDAYGINGLQFLCNTNSDNTVLDFFVGQTVLIGTTNGVRTNQGDPNPQGVAAGNTFSTAGSYNQIENFPNLMRYYWFTTPEKPTAVYPANNVQITKADNDRTCPTSGGSGCLVCSLPVSQINTEILGLPVESNINHNYNLLLQSLIDGGNTIQLKTDVANATKDNVSSVYGNLLSISPYLSTTVLNQVASRSDLFSTTHIFNVMYANPDAIGYQPLLDTLQNIIGSDMVDSLVRRMVDTTSRTNLQNTIAIHSSNMDSMSRDVIIFTKSDTTGFAHGNYRSVLAGLKDIAADYMRIEDYWAAGNSDSALSTMDSLTAWYPVDTLNDSAYLTFKAFLMFRKSLRDDSVSISNLDSAHVLSLNNIAQNGVGPARRSARAALHFFYNYPYVTQLETTVIADSTRALKVNYKKPTSNTPAYLNVYPNPTKDLETFAYKLPCDNIDGFLVIADMIGHTLYSGIVSNGAGLTTIDTKYWPNGLYLYKMSCNDKVIGSGKFEVFR